MIVTEQYALFLQAASHELQAEGARDLLPADREEQYPDWVTSWGAILLLDTPGAASITAFTAADNANRDELQARVDRLVGGLANVGLFRGPAIALQIVAVYERGASPEAVKAATQLVPRAFIGGLRPRSFAVDLGAGKVYGKKNLALYRVLEDSLAHGRQPAALSPEYEDRRLGNRSRTRRFYALMQGRRPYGTYCLVFINVVIFALTAFTAGSAQSDTVLHGGPVSDSTVRTWGALSPILIEHGQWWRLFTEMFLHGSLTHIAFNMASLLAIGTLAERLYGTGRFLAIYLGAGLCGSLVSFGYAVANGNLSVLGVGASGAIFGVAGALLTVRFQESDVIPEGVRRGISSSMFPLVLISLFLAAITQYVDNSAHIGGILAGAALSFVFPITGARPMPSFALRERG